jgi:tetratricopeptide (TPR) repeat protein
MKLPALLARLLGLAVSAIVLTLPPAPAQAQSDSQIALGQAGPSQAGTAQAATPQGNASQSAALDPESELQAGITLTREAHFSDAIPHFLAAKGHVTESYAADFDLALCYVATQQNKPAIALLNDLRDGGHASSEVENLLAQAYVGDGQNGPAFDAFEKAAELTPRSEKLYLYISDACMQRRSYELGLKVLNEGVENLPQSPRLRYERALFENNLERYDLARADFDEAKRLAPESEFAYLADAQENLLEGNVSEAVHSARAGVARFPDNYILLQLLGEALMHAGVSPGQPEFGEALAALEKSVAQHPEYGSSQTALGKLYLMENHLDDAIAHLEIARRLDPSNTSVYSHLATAYRRKGQPDEAQKMLTILANLNDAEAGKIRAGPPARGGSSGSPE